MNASLEQMILDAVNAPGVTHQIGAALIVGDTLEIGFIVQRAVAQARKDYADLEATRRWVDEDEGELRAGLEADFRLDIKAEFRAEIEARKREDAMDAFTGLMLTVKP